MPNYAQLGRFDLISDFSINITLVLVKAYAQKLSDRPHVQLFGELPSLNLRLKRSVYVKIMNISRCFALPDEGPEQFRKSVSMEDIRVNRVELMKKADKAGPIYLQGSAIKQWEKYMAVLSGGYIYFFKSPKDMLAERFVWIKNSTIQKMDAAYVEFKYAFHVKNRYGECMLGCQSEKQMNDWIEIIKSKTSNSFAQSQQEAQMDGFDLDAFREGDKHKSERQPQLSADVGGQPAAKPVDHFEKVFFASFLIRNVNLYLYEEEEENEFLKFQTSQIEMDLKMFPTSLDCSLKLGGMYLIDSIYPYQDFSLNTFITSVPEGEKQIDLITINIAQVQEGHPKYNNTDLIVNV